MHICLSSPHYVSTAPVAAAAAAVVLVNLQARRCMDGEVSADGGHGAAAARYPLATRSFLRRPQLRPHFIPGATAARAHCAARKWVTSVCRWGWMPRSDGTCARVWAHRHQSQRVARHSGFIREYTCAVVAGTVLARSRVRSSDTMQVTHNSQRPTERDGECHARTHGALGLVKIDRWYPRYKINLKYATHTFPRFSGDSF